MFSQKILAFVGMFVLVFSVQLFAQTPEELFEMSLEDLLNVEITSVSKKAESAVEAPQTVIVITSDQIERRGYIDLEQLIHDLPGFDISRGNGTHLANIYQRGYRSNNTDRILLLIDGVEENDLWSGNIWLTRQYPLTNIKRVEIIYGPASTIYGANAYVGVINVVTKDVDDYIKNKNKFGVSAHINYGSWDTKYADVTLAGKHDEVELAVTGRIYQSDEMDLSEYDDWDYDLGDYSLEYYKDYLGTDDDAIAARAKALDQEAYYNDPELGGKEPHYSNQTDDWFVSAKLGIKDFTFGFEKYRRDEGYGAWYRDDFELGPENGGRWVAENMHIYAKYETQINPKLSLTSFTRFKAHMLDGDCEELYYIGYMNGGYGLEDIADSLGNLLPEDEQAIPYWWHGWYHTYSQQMRTELRTVYNFKDNLSFILGGELRKSHIQGKYLVSEEEYPEETAPALEVTGGNHFFSTDLGLFLQGTYKIQPHLSLILGGRVDHNSIRVNGGYGTEFNPKAAIVYAPRKFIAKLIYSEAFKDADYWTKFGTVPGRLLINPNLEPEKVKNIEVSLGYKATQYLFLDFSAYLANYSGVVGTAEVEYEGGTTTQHQALGSLRIIGGQADVRYKYKNYEIFSNVTYTDPQNTEGDEDVRIGDIADYGIRFGINAKYFEKLNINLRGNYIGEKPTGENTTISANPLDKIDAYFVLNSAISYQLLDSVTGQVIVNNILDEEYFHPGVRSAGGGYYAAKMPQNERNVMVRLLYEF